MAGREPKKPRLDGTIRLFVRNIDERLCNNEIRDAFSPHANVILAYNTGKGYGFVHTQTINEAEDLVSIMDKRIIRVSVANYQGKNCDGYIRSQMEEICYDFTMGKCKNARNCPKGFHICGWCIDQTGKIENHSADDPCCPNQTEGYIRNSILCGVDEHDGWSGDDIQEFEDELTQASDVINQKISDQGDKILRMRSDGSTMADLNKEIKALFDLKAHYKAVTGMDWKGQTVEEEGGGVQIVLEEGGGDQIVQEEGGDHSGHLHQMVGLMSNTARDRLSSNTHESGEVAARRQVFPETSSSNHDKVSSNHSKEASEPSSSLRREPSKPDAKPLSPPKPNPSSIADSKTTQRKTVREPHPPSPNDTLGVEHQLNPTVYEDHLPVMVVIGSTGTGKSTLCNVVSGLQPDDQHVFPVSSNMESCTNKTTVTKVQLSLGEDKLSFVVIDTPGLLDPSPGQDKFNIEEMKKVFKTIKSVNIFVLVFNGACPRFDTSFFAMLDTFSNIFGKDFMKNNVVLEFSNWGYDEQSVRKRGQSKNEEFWQT